MQNFYNVSEITDEMLYNTFDDVDVIERKGIGYCNCPCSFDIETSSFYQGKEKRAIMYLWQLDLNGLCIYGREWEEFTNLMLRLSTLFDLGKKFRLVIYVHNLAYEFQFMRKYFTWLEVFARETRKPMQALTDLGIMFKCSYVLSGYSLAKVAQNLTTYKIEKLPDFDYTKVRHSKTSLTEREMEYALNDIVIIEYYIREEIERNGDITKIPLTQTGYVRRLVKEHCYNRENRRAYKQFRELMNTLVISPDEYKQLKRAFQGGFTHASAYYSGVTLDNVHSDDLSSAYPTVMVNEKFPMSSSRMVTINSEEELEHYLKNYCCIFDIEFINLYPKTIIEHPLSASKCFRKHGQIEDNGRIVSADYLITTMTDVDYSIIKQFYTWDNKRFSNFRIYLRGYLPTPIVEKVVELYGLKTELKGIEGKETEYLHSKQNINSMYGMMVTDINPDEIIYNSKIDEWGKNENDLEKNISEYNKKKQRFLFYPWGIFVTAYTRRNLFTAVLEMGKDYVYSDTDSVKSLNREKHENYFKRFNTRIEEKNKQACEYHNIPFEKTRPKDKFGKEQILGIWDYEGKYDRFKTLGAKRYLVEQNGKNQLTVSGVNKKTAIPYLNDLSKSTGKDIFNLFNTELIIPEGKTGKMIVTYIDSEISGKVVDYNGVENTYNEQSCAHMENTSYSFSISEAYLNYLTGIREDKY